MIYLPIYNVDFFFNRHIKDVHQITRAQYRAEYGCSEVVSRMFKCELCDKEVKHTRNIIGAHMKMVHLISWKEYQEILIKIRQGELEIESVNTYDTCTLEEVLSLKNYSTLKLRDTIFLKGINYTGVDLETQFSVDSGIYTIL